MDFSREDVSFLNKSQSPIESHEVCFLAAGPLRTAVPLQFPEQLLKSDTKHARDLGQCVQGDLPLGPFDLTDVVPSEVSLLCELLLAEPGPLPLYPDRITHNPIDVWL